ncbi:hypothetical protein MKW98_015914, partial [Papaver atlanticum]
MMSNKRSRREMEESMAATLAKCLSLLSHDNGDINYQSVIQQKRMPTSTRSRLYECKTCNKQFPSFQALGGHRASHKKPRLMELYSADNQTINDNQQQAKKQKIHGCSICGLKFPIGQALGGHMRKHRAAMVESSATTATAETTTTTGLSSSSSDDTNISLQEEKLPQVPVLKRSSSSRRVLSLNLDLSLSLLPCDSNDFEFSTIVNANKHMPSTPSMIYKMMSNKRSRGEIEESMAATMAKCLMLLSRDSGEIDYQSVIQQQKMPSSIQGRIYECKTCDKQFPSFQALGGHRAIHKKPRLMELYSSDYQIINDNQQKAKKQKVHECSICGLTFAIGQALGGHMRKHRAAMIESSSTTATAETTTTGLSSSSSDNTNISFQEERLQVPVLKRLNSSRRVLNMMSNKRSRGEMEYSKAAAKAKYLLLLSRDSGEIDYGSVIEKQRMPTSIRGRLYECKTCNKQFPSFQALGGPIYHKKPRLMELYSKLDDRTASDNQNQVKKQKIHECSICGLKFEIGQDFGGHIRRHRAAMIESS